jgi:CIC family chloride channel protein
LQKLLSDYRRRLRSYDSVLAYALLGIVGGLASGLIVILHESDMEPLLEFKPNWCLVHRDEEDLYLVSDVELLAWLEEALAEAEDTDLTEAGIRRWTTTPIPMQATLRQAIDTMRTQTTEAVHVVEVSHNTGRTILHGVVSRDSIERFTLSSVL